MRRFKKAIGLILTSAMILTSLTACGSGNDDSAGTASNPSASEEGKDGKTDADNGTDAGTQEGAAEDITLKLWASKDEQEIIQQMCNNFAEKHPEYNMTFNYAVMELDQSINELKKDAEVAADIFYFPSGGITELTEAGLIYPITIGADEVKANHGEGAVKSCTLADQLYGVPISPNSWFMYYNKSMYSGEEVKSLETMMAKDLGEGIANFSCNIDDSWYMSAFFYAAGGTLYGEDGTDPTQCSWNDAAGVKTGEYLIDLVNNPKYVDDGDGLAGKLMAEGKLAALCSGTWSANTLKEDLGENYAACKLPTINIDGNDNQLSNFADFTALGINTMTKHPKAAMELAVWLGGEECQLLRFETNHTTPTITSLIDNPSVSASPETVALTEQTKYSTPNPKTSKLADYWDPAAAFGAGIVNKDITKENLQSNLDKMVEGFLSTLVSE